MYIFVVYNLFVHCLGTQCLVKMVTFVILFFVDLKYKNDSFLKVLFRIKIEATVDWIRFEQLNLFIYDCILN